MRFDKKYGFLLSFLFFMLLNATFYLATVAPGLTFIDSGELTACGALYGIPHPTGYPLYSLFVRIFISLTSVFKVEADIASNLFSVLCACLAGAVLSSSLHRKTGFIPALILDILLCFHPIVWSAATETEVYALTLLLSSTLLAVFLNTPKKKYYLSFSLLLSYMCGLFLGNHLMIAGFVLPLLFYSALRLQRKKRFFAFFAIVAAAAGASIYLTIYYRSMCPPPLDWGGTSRGFTQLFYHVTGKQYQVWMFSKGALGFLSALSNLLKFIFINPFAPLYLLAVPGIMHLYRKNRPLLFILLACFGLNLAYASSYSIPDISSYMIPSVTVIAVLCAFGSFWLFSKKSARFFIAVVLILAVFPMYNGFRKEDKTGLFLAEDYALSILSFLPESSVYLVNSPGALAWEEVSPIIYFQSIKMHRTDVTVIDKELLRRSWYVIWINSENPDLAESWPNEYNSFLLLLTAWEKGDEVDTGSLQNAFENLIFALYRYGKSRGGFFISNPPSGKFTAHPDHDLRKLSEVSFLPYGFFFTDDSSADDSHIWKSLTLRPVPGNLSRNERVLMITGNIKQSAWRKVYRINMESGGKFTEKSLPYIEFIIKLDPEDTLASGIMNRFY
ncbi:DUF2723 domain-containing protein [candidate division WOR-3 bacterium]|nr:DUF2723 domain-containing protein [candidate division WOR-3 bacterium]